MVPIGRSFSVGTSTKQVRVTSIVTVSPSGPEPWRDPAAVRQALSDLAETCGDPEKSGLLLRNLN